MDESFVQMRDFMSMTESLIGFETDLTQEAIVEAASAAPSLGVSIHEDLKDAVFKLRSFTESREGDLGLGIEMGMQRAAEIIENVINRHYPPGEGF